MFRKILFETEIYFAVWFVFGEQKKTQVTTVSFGLQFK